METPDDAELSPYAGLARKIRGGKSASLVEYENRPPSITVTRRSDESGLVGRTRVLNVFGAAVSTFPFDVELDGQIAGQLARGDVLKLDVTPGEHSLRITTPMSSSKTRSVVIESGQRFKFSCRTKLTGIMLWRED
jgi:hypothetical protein